MAMKNYNTWEAQLKLNEIDNKVEKTYVDEKVNGINTNINSINSSLEDITNTYAKENNKFHFVFLFIKISRNITD